QHMVNGFWERCEAAGRDRNPYRMGFLVPVGVAATDAEAEAAYGPAAEYFYHKGLHLPEQLLVPPGHMTHSSLSHFITKRPFPPYDELKTLRYPQFNDRDFVVCGSAETVTQRLQEIIKTLNVGHLMILPQFGSLSHEQTMENIGRIGKDVLPHLRGMWDDTSWVDHWWPKGAEQRARAAA